MKRRILNLLVAFDQFAYCLITLGHSNPDWTLSASAWRWEQQGKWPHKFLRQLIDALFFFDPEHCYASYLKEVSR